MYKNFSTLQSKFLLFATILISGISFFETTAVNVAIPAIQKSFTANLSFIQWAINSYNLMLAVFIIIMGTVSDRYGHKKLLGVGLTLFAVGSALCGYATNIWVLIIARIIQGLGGAMIIPQSVAIINTSFEDKIRGQALGIWGALSGLLTIMGPFVSGYIVDTYGWKMTFLILVPFSILGLILVLYFVPKAKLLKKSPLDWPSVITLALGMSLLSFGLIQASSQDWGEPILYTTIISGIVLLYFFIRRQKYTKHPLVNLKVIGERNVLLANIFTMLLYAIISALAFFAVMFFQQVEGYSATRSGLALMPVSIVIAILAVFAGALADKTGPRIPMMIGAGCVTTGLLLLLMVKVHTNYWVEIFPGMLFIGLGFGIFVPSLTKAALTVPSEYSGTASGVNNSLSRIAGLLGVALLGAIMVGVFHTSLRMQLTKAGFSPEITRNITKQSTQLMEIDLSVLPVELHEQTRERIRVAFLNAYKVQLFLCAVLAAGGVVTAALMKKRHVQD